MLSLLLLGCTPTGSSMAPDDASRVRDMVQRQLQQYPQSRLIDIYKNCFQDYMGPEHMVDEPSQARANLTAEVSGLDMDSLSSLLYEPCGLDSQYYRINLRAVAEGRISLSALNDAFVRSAQLEHPSVDKWRQRWQGIQQVISDMHLQLPSYNEDSTAIAAMLGVGDYALSHSDEYRAAYYPHYRLVARDIFEAELKDKLDGKK